MRILCVSCGRRVAIKTVSELLGGKGAEPNRSMPWAEHVPMTLGTGGLERQPAKQGRF